MKSTVSRCIILIAAAFAALATSSRSAARPWPDTTSGVYVFNDQLTSAMNPALTQFCATHYAGCQKMIRSDALRAYNANPVQFTCQARTTSGWINVTDVCLRSSSAPGVATVSNRGLVTPVSRGSASITARYLYNGSYLSTSAGVQVAY